MKKAIASVLAAASLLFGSQAFAAEKGEAVAATNVGMNAVSWNLSQGTTKTVADQQALSEFVGAHYFVTDTVRVGMMMQFTEVLAPEPKYSRFSKFALLPQVGWHFWGPMYAAAIFTYAPRTQGGANTVLGVQALIGAGFKLTEGVRLNVALEVPYDFHPEHVVGLTPLVGLSFKL